MTFMAKNDIDGVTTRRLAKGELHRRTPARGLGASKDELLQLEVHAVRNRTRAVALQFDAKWPLDRECQPLPAVEGVAAAVATLDRADCGAAQVGDSRDVGLPETMLQASAAQLAAEASKLLEIAPGRFG